MHIEVTRDVLTAIRAEAEQAHPQECCGILLWAGDRVAGIVPARNVHPAPETHFEIDPQALIDAHRGERAGGPAIAGYYHSHPNGRSGLSAQDRRNGAGDGKLWLVIAGSVVTIWEDRPDGFASVSYQAIER